MNVLNIFDMNKKNTVTINEAKLRKIVNESVKAVLAKVIKEEEEHPLKRQLTTLFETINENGQLSMLPSLIAGALKSAKFPNTTNDKILYWTAKHCERLTNNENVAELSETLKPSEMLKGRLVSMFESAYGMFGALPSLIAECLKEANMSELANDTALYWTAKYCERLVNRNKIVGRVNDR